MGSGFLSYVDLEMDNDFRISRALIVLSDMRKNKKLNRAGDAGGNGAMPNFLARKPLCTPTYIDFIRGP